MTVRLGVYERQRRRTPLSTRSAEGFVPTDRRSGGGALTAKARPGVWRKNRREMSMRLRCAKRRTKRVCGAPRGARRDPQGSRTP
jgi:hypothetical protein